MTDPKRALIVIDVQNEYFGDTFLIEYPPVEESLNNILQTMDAAKAADIPIVVVQHSAPEDSPIFAKGSVGWELHPAVGDKPRDLLIEKELADAFANTDLMSWLNQRQINTLTVVGYMTHNCDASTIYHAAHAGFTVEFLADASGSLPYENQAGKASAEEIHRVFSVVFHSNFAAVTSTKDWIQAIQDNRAISLSNIFESNHRARGKLS